MLMNIPDSILIPNSMDCLEEQRKVKVKLDFLSIPCSRALFQGQVRSKFSHLYATGIKQSFTQPVSFHTKTVVETIGKLIMHSGNATKYAAKVNEREKLLIERKYQDFRSGDLGFSRTSHLSSNGPSETCKVLAWKS